MNLQFICLKITEKNYIFIEEKFHEKECYFVFRFFCIYTCLKSSFETIKNHELANKEYFSFKYHISLRSNFNSKM